MRFRAFKALLSQPNTAIKMQTEFDLFPIVDLPKFSVPTSAQVVEWLKATNGIPSIDACQLLNWSREETHHYDGPLSVVQQAYILTELLDESPIPTFYVKPSARLWNPVIDNRAVIPACLTARHCDDF